MMNKIVASCSCIRKVVSWVNEIEKLLAQINALAQKQRTSGLNELEKAEQAMLRRTYLDYIKGQVKAQLDCIRVVPVDDEPPKGH